jgi:PAS domain S-box-containing protein
LRPVLFVGRAEKNYIDAAHRGEWTMRDGGNLSHNEYKTIVEQAPIMIWRANTGAECDYFNQQWLAFTGRRMEQELGNGWAEGVFPEDVERCLEIYQSAFAKHEVFEMEYRLRRHDGEYRWIFDRGVPFDDEEGNFGGYIGSCIDVTEAVEARKLTLKERDSEIRQLRSMLPICSSCKKIKDDEGYWRQIEVYIQEHSSTVFTHGLCPECLRKLYPEYVDDREKG